MPSRRHFLRWAGAAATASLASGGGFAAEPATEQQPAKARSKRTYELGLASYTFLNSRWIKPSP